MAFERFFISPEAEVPKRSANLSAGFRDVVSSKMSENPVFRNLEEALTEEGFTLANTNTVAEILQSNSLLCRSENFGKVMDLLLEGQPIQILNRKNQANMCSMSSGSGFKIAMVEGFNGEDVGDMVKTVITFRGEHLASRDLIPHDAELWQMKPNTAQVSLAGRGEITLDDIAMVSFRFPVHLFPEELLTEEEQERLEDSGIHFIVRHYTPNIKKATH